MAYGDVYDFIALQAHLATESGKAHRAVKDFAEGDFKLQAVRQALQESRINHPGLIDVDDATLDRMAAAAAAAWR
jgi:hypothetical protein